MRSIFIKMETTGLNMRKTKIASMSYTIRDNETFYTHTAEKISKDLTAEEKDFLRENYNNHIDKGEFTDAEMFTFLKQTVDWCNAKFKNDDLDNVVFINAKWNLELIEEYYKRYNEKLKIDFDIIDLQTPYIDIIGYDKQKGFGRNAMLKEILGFDEEHEKTVETQFSFSALKTKHNAYMFEDLDKLSDYPINTYKNIQIVNKNYGKTMPQCATKLNVISDSISGGEYKLAKNILQENDDLTSGAVIKASQAQIDVINKNFTVIELAKYAGLNTNKRIPSNFRQTFLDDLSKEEATKLIDSKFSNDEVSKYFKRVEAFIESEEDKNKKEEDLSFM